jgi:hypothetical protein
MAKSEFMVYLLHIPGDALDENCDLRDGEISFSCMVYNRKTLEEYEKFSESGIFFVDTKGADLFRIPDGGRIQVTDKDTGEVVKQSQCFFLNKHRFITEGAEFDAIEFARLLEANHMDCRPLKS